MSYFILFHISKFPISLCTFSQKHVKTKLLSSCLQPCFCCDSMSVGPRLDGYLAVSNFPICIHKAYGCYFFSWDAFYFYCIISFVVRGQHYFQVLNGIFYRKFTPSFSSRLAVMYQTVQVGLQCWGEVGQGASQGSLHLSDAVGAQLPPWYSYKGCMQISCKKMKHYFHQFILILGKTKLEEFAS